MNIKVLWHSALVLAALYEFTISETRGRKLLCGGAAGHHLAAVVQDWE